MKKWIKKFWQAYQRLQRGFNQRSLTQRFLFFSIFLIALGLAFGAFNFYTLARKNLALDQDLEKLNTQMLQQTKNINAMEQKIEAMKADQADFEKKNPNVIVGAPPPKINPADYIVDASDMEVVLRTILDRMEGISLEKMERQVNQVDYNGKKIPLYQHDFHLTLRGNYVATYNYLKELETLEWRLFWNTLDYQVSDYPNATVKLEVFIFSDH